MSINPEEIFIVIPVYNNKNTINDVVTRCLNEWKNVLVINDGSTDCSITDVLKNKKVTILSHTSNLGKGAALNTSLNYLNKKNIKYMITIDADGQHYPEDIPKFINILQKTQVPVIILGEREFDLNTVPKASIFGRKFSNFWVRMETGISIPDTQTGFRAYPVKELSGIKIKSKSYDYEIESLVKLIWNGAKVVSILTSVFYPPPEERISHFNKLLDNLILSQLHTKLILKRLFPHPKHLVSNVKTNFKDIPITFNPLKILKMILYDHSSPSSLAASASAGVFLGTLPIFGFHVASVLYVSMRLHLNKAMSLSIQNLCAPPFIPALCIYIGYFLRTGTLLNKLSYDIIFNWNRLLEWILGALILAPVLSLVTFIIVYLVAKASHKKTA